MVVVLKFLGIIATLTAKLICISAIGTVVMMVTQEVIAKLRARKVDRRMYSAFFLLTLVVDALMLLVTSPFIWKEVSDYYANGGV